MGGLCTATATPVTTSSSVLSGTQIPNWVSQGGQDLWQQASVLAAKPYTTYTGQRVSDLNADQNAGFSDVRNNQGSYKPDLTTAGTLTGNAAQGWDGTTAAKYMNPYTQNVTDIAIQELQRQGDKQAVQRGADAVNAGAFGSARQGVLDAEATRDLNQQVSNLAAQGQAAAYTNGQQQFNTDQSRQLSAGSQFGALGQLSQNLGYNDANAAIQSGALQQAQTQKSLDTAYQDFQTQQQWPYQQINWATGVLKGVPYTQNTTTQQTGQQLVQQPSALGQLAGAGVAAAALSRAF